MSSLGRQSSQEFQAIHSKWEEPVSHPYLTLYDQHRPPHHLDENDSTRQMTLKLKEDLSEFRCGVCMGWIKKTVVVMGCLHRFCASCMEESLRSRNYFCPKCRKALPSKRNLRPDPRYDKLIASILGDLEELEAKEDVEVEEMHKKLGVVAPRPKRRLRSGEGGGSSETEQQQEEPGYQHRKLAGTRFVKPAKKVEFTLLRHPRERRVDRLAKPDLIVPGDMTVGDIKLFLSKKLSHEPKDDFEILMPKDEIATALDEKLTMSEIKRRKPGSDEEFVLQYRLPAEQTDASTGQTQQQ